MDDSLHSSVKMDRFNRLLLLPAQLDRVLYVADQTSRLSLPQEACPYLVTNTSIHHRPTAASVVDKSVNHWDFFFFPFVFFFPWNVIVTQERFVSSP
jgi:hypothetical protein